MEPKESDEIKETDCDNVSKSSGNPQGAKRAASKMAPIIVVFILTAGLLVVIFGSPVFKSAMPKRYVSRAASKTATGLRVLQSFRPLPAELLKGSYEQIIECGLKDFTSTDAVFNESYMAVLKAMKLTSKTRRDADGGRIDTDLSIGQGSISLLGARLFLTEEEMALNIPQGFDYYITAEPKSFVSDWDQSTFGELVGMEELLGRDFYRAYQELLFSREGEEGTAGQAEWAALTKNATYQYQGKAEEKTGEGMRKTDVYQVVIREEDAKAYAEARFGNLLRKADALAGIVTGKRESFAFQTIRPVGDVTCTLSVYRGVIVQTDIALSISAEGQTTKLSGKVELLGQKELTGEIAGTLDIQSASGGMSIQYHSEGERSGGQLTDATKIIAIQSNGERVDLKWELQWDKKEYARNNLHFSADMTADRGHTAVHANADGKVFEDSSQQYAVWDLNDLRVDMTGDNGELTASMSLRVDLKGGEIEEITFDRGSATAFNKLSVVDLLEIMTRLDRDTGLQGFLTAK